MKSLNDFGKSKGGKRKTLHDGQSAELTSRWTHVKDMSQSGRSPVPAYNSLFWVLRY